VIFTLRPLQERAIQAVREALASVTRVLLVAPTGFGKTATSSELIRRAVERKRRVIFVVHRREIVRDTARRLRAMGVPCAIVMADEPLPAGEPVLVCSIQTLYARGDRPPADLIFWDEAHHCAARTYREIAASYPNAIHVGLTATPERADGTGLADMFDRLVVAATPAELVNAGLLVPCRVIGPDRRLKDLAEDPVAAWQAHTPGARAVVFCANVEHARQTVASFLAAGVPTAMVWGSMPSRERDETLRRFDAGELTVLVNVYVLTEGWDSPATKVCILARGCGSTATFIQMVGRVLRVAEGKDFAVVIDLFGNTAQHGLPTDEREFSLEGAPIRTKEPPAQIRQCPECASVFRPTAAPVTCPDCGYQFPLPAPPRVVHAAIKPLPPGAGAPVEEQRKHWDLLCSICVRRGYKPGWAAHQFKARFGFWPPRNFPRVEAA
jgi:DNA repair protein RadD